MSTFCESMIGGSVSKVRDRQLRQLMMSESCHECILLTCLLLRFRRPMPVV